MSESPILSQAEMAQALLQLLPQAQGHIRIFDRQLESFPLESPAAIALLQPFLARPPHQLTLVLQRPEPTLTRRPRLMDLLRRYAPRFQLLQTPPHLDNLSDASLLIDEAWGIIRFDQNQSRGKILVADKAACRPYIQRFQDILAEGCTPLSASPLGL
ncbi:DUF7931 domain-containing protein [Azospira inquinata]|uniref:DUF7931 domain-containing protein n=1 Tax=Azospira inquinata TaxID=2785627 RepID=A0A975XUD8_9RHOO|nr:hypothetical protein [Azospira inquinata]QWT46012.1 hypothetical protein J8L76_14065 [Azospira inquinata]QWT48660.1 hypothetical protein Azoinq_12545 [Azospira inquinata]